MNEYSATSPTRSVYTGQSPPATPATPVPRSIPLDPRLQSQALQPQYTPPCTLACCVRPRTPSPPRRNLDCDYRTPPCTPRYTPGYSDRQGNLGSSYNMSPITPSIYGGPVGQVPGTVGRASGPVYASQPVPAQIPAVYYSASPQPTTTVFDHWSMDQVEEFFTERGYADEVKYVQSAEYDSRELVRCSRGAVTPIQVFALKMGFRTLDLLRSLRSDGDKAGTGQSSENGQEADSDSVWGRGPSAGSSFRKSDGGDFNSSGGRGRGGRGGGRGGRGGGRGGVCFKCQEPGHFSRECPNDDGSSSGGRGGYRRDGGGGRGGRGGYGGGRGGRNNNGGGGGGDWGNDDNEPASKRPRTTSNSWDSWDDPKPTATSTTAADDDDWETDDKPKAPATKTEPPKTSQDEEDWEMDDKPKASETKTEPPKTSNDDDDWEIDDKPKPPVVTSAAADPVKVEKKTDDDWDDEPTTSKKSEPVPVPTSAPKPVVEDNTDDWE